MDTRAAAPVAESQRKRIVSLPVYRKLTTNDLDYIIKPYSTSMPIDAFIESGTANYLPARGRWFAGNVPKNDNPDPVIDYESAVAAYMENLSTVQEDFGPLKICASSRPGYLMKTVA